MLNLTRPPNAGFFFACNKVITMYYGLHSQMQLADIIASVVDKLGGGNHAKSLLLETCAAETLCGIYPDDNPESLGVGVMQHDLIGLEDLQLNGTEHFADVKKHFGYDLYKTDLADLAYDPLLSVICARLTYKRIPAPIPDTRLGRAWYWKAHYNRSGKGSVHHYMENAGICLGEIA